MGFRGSESESESCSVVLDSLQPHGLYSPWNSPGQNAGVGSRSLLQGIYPTQESNPGLPHCRRIMLSQISQAEKNKCCMISLTYRIQKNPLVYRTKKRQIHRYENKLVVTRGKREEGEEQDRGRGLRGRTTKYIINKLQGYSVQHREYSQQFITVSVA